MKLTALTKRTEYPVIIRKLLQKNILRFRSDITKAIEFHLKADSTFQEKITRTYALIR